MIGVVVLVILAIAGGTRLLEGPGNGTDAVARALGPFPGFGAVTPARRAVGSRGSAAAAYAAIMAQGTVDWRAQFARAGVPWQDPGALGAVPVVSGSDRRADLVLLAGTRLSDWAQQLMGIPGLLEIAHRKGRISTSAMAADRRDLDACLAGAWGRSLDASAELAAAAAPAQASWVRRGAARGVPADCAGAAGG